MAVLIVYSNAVSDGHGIISKAWIAPTSERTMEKTFEVSPGGELVVDTDIGDVRVEGWDKNEVNVIVEKSGSERRYRRFDITFDATKEKVVIRGKYEHKWRFWDAWGNFDVHYTIKVPNKFRLNVSTAGGDVILNDVEGLVKGETSGGSVNAMNIKGDTRLETSGGDVHIESVVGAVNLGTSGGSIRADGVEGQVTAETSGGDIEVRLVGENRGIRMETSGGSITLYLPDGAKGDLDASTSGGGVKLRLGQQFSGSIQEDEVHGRINGGGALIKAETSGGDIWIYTR